MMGMMVEEECEMVWLHHNDMFDVGQQIMQFLRSQTVCDIDFI